MKKNFLILNIFEIILILIISITTSFAVIENYSIIWFFIILFYVLLFIIQIKFKHFKFILYLKYLVPITFSVFFIINKFYHIEPVFISYLLFIFLQCIFCIIENKQIKKKNSLKLLIFMLSISLIFIGLLFLQKALLFKFLCSTIPGSENEYQNIGQILILLGSIGTIFSSVHLYLKSK